MKGAKGARHALLAAPDLSCKIEERPNMGRRTVGSKGKEGVQSDLTDFTACVASVECVWQ